MNTEFEKRSNAVFKALSILAEIDPHIVFLGGSAIQTLLKEPKRLSIDLDISYSGNAQNLINGLEKAGYLVNQRKSRNPNFLLYTLSKDSTMIKLDIGKFKISETEKRKINGVEVLFPKQCYFLAAKLSSLAFGTIGRLEEEPSQVIKDVFDINCLLELKSDLEKMPTYLQQAISDQNKLRGSKFREAETAESIEKTLLKCIDAAPAPSFYIPQSALGSFQDTLTSGRVTRQDLVTMAARAMLLYACKGSEFYETEGKIAKEAGDAKNLENTAKALLDRKMLSAQQLHALKLTAPKALIYLKYWATKRKD